VSDTIVKDTRHAVCVIAEDLAYPLDEGIKHCAVSLLQSWSKQHRVLGISVRSPGKPAAPHTVALRTNKLFLSYRLRSALRRFRPEVIFYVPSASATIFSFLRAWTLKYYCPGARVAMVSLQPRRYGLVSRFLIRRLAPDVIFVQSQASRQQLDDLGCRTELFASGVDLEKFTPVSREKKIELRTKYGLDPKAFTVLHVGHITEGRNIGLLNEVNHQNAAQVALVGSSLAHRDRDELSARLKGQGINIFNEYFKDIQELYQLADCYLFPVFSEQSSIGVPLSVLEAMACNLPVITARYGLLPHLFSEGQGLLFADTAEEMVQGVSKVRNMNGCHTREKVAGYSWEKVTGDILKQTGISRGQTDIATQLAFWKENKYPLLSIKNQGDLAGLTGSPEFQTAWNEENAIYNSLKSEFDIIREQWEKAGIRSLLIKSGDTYPSFPYTSDNLDVLVRKEDESAARKILLENGYIELKNIEEPKKFLFRKFSEGVSVSAIHLHTEIIWLVGFMDEKALWERARTAPDDASVTAPSPEDIILINIAHSFYENKKFRLADIEKIRNQWRQNTIDWGYMEKTAAQRGWLDGLYFGCLVYAHLEKAIWGKTALSTETRRNLENSLKRSPLVYRYYRQVIRRTPVRLPFKLSFLFSKYLYYKKILRDRCRSLAGKLNDIIITLIYGIKLKAGIQIQPSFLISISGPDGSGKTTHARNLEKVLIISGLWPKYYWNRTATSRFIRSFSAITKKFGKSQPLEAGRAESGAAGREGRLKNPLIRFFWSYLVAADMVWAYFCHVRLPMLWGRVVICDRYACDAAVEMECSLPPHDRINRMAIKLMLALTPRPNIAYFLDIPDRVSAGRKSENTDMDYLQLQREAYCRLVKRYNMRVKNTDGDFRTIADEISSETLNDYYDRYEDHFITRSGWLFLFHANK
jgi:glycosyltransferase involved in cell wall biosynthesis/thymidylate kinase